jgi:Phosphotransferase enzyme family
MTWKRLPGSRRLLVDACSGRTSRLVRTLAGTSDWRRDVVDQAGVAALLAVGTARLPSARPIEWPRAGIDQVEADLRTELPGLRLIGVATPRQSGRERISAVGRMTGNLVVVKLAGRDTTLEREGTVLDLLAANPLPGIATPMPLAAGQLVVGTDVATYLVTTAVALRHQRAAIDQPLRTFEADLAERLSSLPLSDTQSTDAGHSGDLVPIHGDLTPWNLRRTTRGLALFDWESAGWGEAGSDLAHYRVACDQVRRPWASLFGRTSVDDPLGARR